MQVDTIILGAGAAGLMCAIHAGGNCLLLDHARAPGEKIRISGGGRCNFTNTGTGPENFLSRNPHFAKSALSRFTPWDFIAMVDAAGIAWHEKTLGQLFCDGSAKQIVAMLTNAARAAGAQIQLHSSIDTVTQTPDGFTITAQVHDAPAIYHCRNLVLATGGKSIPKMGATGIAYQIAERLGLAVTPTRPGLVPLTFGDRFAPLSGLALPVRATAGNASFDEAMLCTHRGLSGPAILQISSYWQDGDPITLDLSPAQDIAQTIATQRQSAGGIALKTALRKLLPPKLVDFLAPTLPLNGNLADQSDAALAELAQALHHWQLKPTGSEGYRTAEVTTGGIDTDGLSSKTMEARSIPGLFAIGEAVDVTGWLGGYNFQWAWASGFAAGTAIAARR